jgi:hypothetical protein
MTTPRHSHWLVSEIILIYLIGTMYYGISYLDIDIDLYLLSARYSYADLDGSLNDIKSTIGYMFHLGSNAVLRISKKQHKYHFRSLLNIKKLSLSLTAENKCSILVSPSHLIISCNKLCIQNVLIISCNRGKVIFAEVIKHNLTYILMSKCMQ